MDDQNNPGYTKMIFYLLLFLSVVLAGFLLKTISSVIIPVVLSFILSLVLLPIIKKVNLKTGIPWVVSSLTIVILFFVALLGITSILVGSLSGIVAEYPKYESKFMSVYKAIAPALHLEVNEGESFINNACHVFPRFE